MENDIKDTLNENTVISVEVDGETRQIGIKQAALLCKDGIKFQSLKENYDRLVSAAKAENRSVPQFLDTLEIARTEKRKKELVEKCGGNEEMALHIMELEALSDGGNYAQDEFKEYFPETDIESVPECVKEKAKQNNTSLLDEYLRYRAKKELSAKKEELKRKENEASSTGSLKSSRDISFEGSEFLKGIWR